jgi:hypothetical protein
MMMSTGSRSLGATAAGDEVQQMAKVPVALAGENWRVEKRRLETSKEIEDLYDESIAKCLDMNAVANQKALDAYNLVYSKIKHTSPPLPITHSKLVMAYCHHLMTSGTLMPFAHKIELIAWMDKAKGDIQAVLFKTQISELAKELL